MAEYTVVKVSDVPDQSQNLGHDPEQFEIRFLRNDLGCEDCGVSFARYSKGFASRRTRTTARRRSTSSYRDGHRHSSETTR